MLVHCNTKRYTQVYPSFNFFCIIQGFEPSTSCILSGISYQCATSVTPLVSISDSTLYKSIISPMGTFTCMLGIVWHTLCHTCHKIRFDSFVGLNIHPKQRVQAQDARQGQSPSARERKRAHAPLKTHLMRMCFAHGKNTKAVIIEGGGWWRLAD